MRPFLFPPELEARARPGKQPSQPQPPPERKGGRSPFPLSTFPRGLSDHIGSGLPFTRSRPSSVASIREVSWSGAVSVAKAPSIPMAIMT